MRRWRRRRRWSRATGTSTSSTARSTCSSSARAAQGRLAHQPLGRRGARRHDGPACRRRSHPRLLHPHGGARIARLLPGPRQGGHLPGHHARWAARGRGSNSSPAPSCWRRCPAARCCRWPTPPRGPGASNGTSFVIPLPFSRIVIAIGPPRYVPRAIDPAALERLQGEMELELRRLFEEAAGGSERRTASASLGFSSRFC